MRKVQGSDLPKSPEWFSIISKGVPFIFVTIIILVLYGSATKNFWLGDDPQILRHAILYHPWEYFFIPGVWREFSANNFTPWVIFSFDIDWKIFGLRPYAFYVHQLVSLCLLSAVTYAVLRLWYPRFLSLFGVSLFAVSVPFAESAQLLMTRHYIEGAIFAFLCVYFFVSAVRNNDWRLSLVSAFFYLLACTAKEIYVPLLCLLPIIPESNFRNRLRMCLPFLVILIIYVSWRWFMLGRLLGGYGLESMGMQQAKFFFLRIADTMVNGLSGELIIARRWLIVGSSLLALSLWIIINRKAVLYILLIAPLILSPIIPVESIMGRRHIWLLTLCWVILHISTWQRLKQDLKHTSVHICVALWGAILLSVFLYSSSHALVQMKASIKQQREENNFVLKKGIQTDLLFTTHTSGWAFAGLLWLRKEVLHLPKGPSVSADAHFICFENHFEQDYKSVWRFDMQKSELLSEPYYQYKNKLCSQEAVKNIRLDVPLSLDLQYSDSTAAWVFGPYEVGSYALLAGETAEGIFPLPFSGRRFVHINDSALPVRIRYISPEGWVTYSPILNLEVKNGRGRLEWQR